MRAYSRDDEERVRLQALVRAWTRAGLVDADRGAALEATVRTNLRRTNDMLRAVLAFFTAVIVAAVAGFVAAFFRFGSDSAMAIWLAVIAVAAIASADRLIVAARLYRFGVEEALAAMAVLFASVSVVLLGGEHKMAATFAFAAVACLAIFARYGFVYAAVAAMVCAALVPFQPAWLPSTQRIAAAAVFAAAFTVARRHHRAHGDDYPGDASAVLEAVAWLGGYLVLNIQLTMPLTADRTFVPEARWFYWASYAVVWTMPVVGLWLGIRDKHRALIAVNLVLAVLTLATNKSYLGWRRYSWDPMLLGALLMGAALVIRRWLDSGPRKQRFGFTAESVLDADRDLVTVLGNVSAALHPQAAHRAPPSDHSDRFGGGRSGGGGASGSF